MWFIKEKISLIFTLLLLNAKAGILNSECFDVDQKGQLTRDNKGILCKNSGDHLSEFDSSHAKGLTRYGNIPFDISVVKKSVDEFVVYEVTQDMTAWVTSADLGASSTRIKNGKVKDQTSCTRHIQKDMPLVVKDELTCITINQTFCSNLYNSKIWIG